MKFREFLADESAATAIEYAIIATMVSLILFVPIRTLGNKIFSLFLMISEALAPTPQPPPQMPSEFGL